MRIDRGAASIAFLLSCVRSGEDLSDVEYQDMSDNCEGLQRTAREVREAHAHLSQLLTRAAPDCVPLPDLPGLATQIDNLIAGLKPRT